MNEAQYQWPDSPLNIIVSLGTGKWKDKDSQLENDVLFFLNKKVDLLTDTEEKWNQLKSEVNHDDKCFRWNPQLSFNCGLDDISQLDTLITNTISDIETHQGKVNRFSIFNIAISLKLTKMLYGTLIGSENSC